MSTTTFTTRIETDLKVRLEKIAAFEDRSASYMANQAIKALVEEREASHGLIDTALEILDQAEVFAEDAVEAWLDAPAGSTFPEPTTR